MRKLNAAEFSDKFWGMVDKGGVCWVWKGRLKESGYGEVWRHGRHERAHRVAYVLSGKTIPTGLQLDHLCRNRACVNPGHLEPVTMTENTRRGNGFAGINSRKTVCKRGHRLEGKNVYEHRPGRRTCRSCVRVTRGLPPLDAKG